MAWILDEFKFPERHSMAFCMGMWLTRFYLKLCWEPYNYLKTNKQKKTPQSEKNEKGLIWYGSMIFICVLAYLDIKKN